MFWRKRAPSWPNLEIDEIRKRARILVIDDSDFAYVELFKRDGYAIEQLRDVDDLTKLESNAFDVVLLDIQGVGTAISQEAGLGVLRHIKEVNPAQIVVAFSNADFSLKYKSFFDMADAAMAKGADYVTFKKEVDRLLVCRFSLGFYVERVVELGGAEIGDKGRLRALTEEALSRRRTDDLRAYLAGQRVNADVISLMLQVVQIGLEVSKL